MESPCNILVFIQTKRSSCRNFFHHKSYSFLSRTVRLTNSNPKALLLGCRGTLAQNRGTMGGVQIPFSFPKSLDFKPLQTKVRILPWQMKSTRIIKISYPKMPSFARFYRLFRAFIIFKCKLHNRHIFARISISQPCVVVKS